MNILFGTDNSYQTISGATTFTYELAKGLAKKGHRVSVIAPSGKFRFTVTKRNGITIYGTPSVIIPKIIYPLKVRVSLPLTTNAIKKLIKGINPEIIHIQDHYPLIGSKVADAGRKLQIPLIGTNHFMSENFAHYLHSPDFIIKPITKLAWKQFINVYKHLDIITTPTKTAAESIKNLGLKNPIIPISNGVDLDRFNPKNNGNYLKRYYKIPSLDKIALFVGRLDKEKHSDVLVKAMTLLPPHAHIKLVITGKGIEKANLIKLAKRLGVDKDVIFTGFVPNKDLPFLYGMADLFVIASIAELQSIATMEAMASGLPIVATKVMALPELVHHGKNGYLFNRGDSKMLAEEIIKILKYPALRRKMSENSLKIIKRHDFNKTVRSYENLYQKLIIASKRRP